MESRLNTYKSRIIFLITFIFCLSTLHAQDKDEKEEKKPSIKAYDKVITSEANTSRGIMSIHKIENKYFLEIPDSIFGRDIMTITRMAKTPTGAGYGGEEANRQVIRFEKGPDRNVFIRVVSYINVSADSLQPIYQSVQNSNVSPIAAAFDILSIGDKSVVIEVGDFFRDPNQAFNLTPATKQYYKLKKLEKDRTFINYISVYPINMEIRTTMTYSVDPPKLSDSDKPSSNSVDLSGGLAAGVVTFEMNTSMILLPEVPMRRRFFDPRVGIFANRYTTFKEDGQRAEKEVFAVRWRLEAKNDVDAQRQQNGELIDPVKPIVFYIDPATPHKWRKPLKQGVEDWKVAFEQAGWSNAIQAKDWPEDRPGMSLDDARFSVIRYFASETQNAYGPNVHDPRSGEIIESHIGWYHNVMKLLKRWYTTQASAVDPNARNNELDDELMGKLVRFVSAHEVGHTLGLRHNFGASFATPVEMLRDKEFMDANGHTSSIMDYARFNYVAQPEDGISDLFPRVGDYDKWAIEWNYKPIYNTENAAEDKVILNQWYKEKAQDNQRLHFITSGSPYDPRAQSEDLGDNSVKASEYGIKNLKRILPSALDWTKEDAEHYTMAREFYNDVVNQYNRYIRHVSKWVGGIYETPKTYDQEGVVYEPAPRQRQAEAVGFLNQHLFNTPEWLLDQNIVNRIRPDQGVAFLSKIQESTIKSLFGVRRLQRLIETKAFDNAAYGVNDLFSDLYSNIWSEMLSGNTTTTHRRNAQRIYLDQLIKLLNPKEVPAPSFWFEINTANSIDPNLTDIVSISRGHLTKMQQDINRNIKKQSDQITKYHLEDCLYRIKKALDID